ncbi:hypothetical protein [Streptomyces kanasensis]|uniref:Uncharacterized protein n=1 Tax=Streptomyces kanasensis TaxID=936756 RepID=A0A100Y4W5_9ACTN|nr:hypothetical protein [Streptomyces kanasensis]KUH37741.1 hypothetical protein ATE80_16465 [Streptomyces kanasensis]
MGQGELPQRADLGFTRQTSQDVPRTPAGLPVHATSVLIGDEHYDNERLDSRTPCGFRRLCRSLLVLGSHPGPAATGTAA